MLLTQRQAAAYLVERLDVSRRVATRVLNAGLAGEPQRAGGVLIYERERVERLVDRRPVGGRASLPPECHGGVLLARTTDPVDPLGSVLGPTRFAPISAAMTRLLAPQGQDWFPMVVTLHHFVVAGAELLDFAPVPRDHPDSVRATSWPGRPTLWTLSTRPPGSWFADTFADRTLPSGPGNRYLWLSLPEGWGNCVELHEGEPQPP